MKLQIALTTTLLAFSFSSFAGSLELKQEGVLVSPTDTYTNIFSSQIQMGFGYIKDGSKPDNDKVNREGDGTFIIERTGQLNGVSDTGSENPTVWVRNDGNFPSTALKASSRKPGSIDMVVGDTSTDGYRPQFQKDSPALFVGESKLNTNGSKNSATGDIKHLAVEVRGAIKLCGKSGSRGDECQAAAFLYVADGGNLIVRSPSGESYNLLDGLTPIN
ncbi:hypothetical protein C9I98_06175 [Photobacterium sanctipauli]|uniref:Uncharacterized protein n=1 Tax=Photobacterium sanctipauli TaxID=1342794 RepID=A0A2T3NZ00_9GAMM|nr:hypothetical protein [Photobacterium sanctipauli]PSW21506.1 hypothetical protein C9I98_06175 [Photobacterium sanctipauli]